MSRSSTREGMVVGGGSGKSGLVISLVATRSLGFSLSLVSESDGVKRPETMADSRRDEVRSVMRS